MMEPDLMFLDPATILFYTLCVASFLAGAWLFSWLSPSSFDESCFETRLQPTLFLLIPLLFGIAATTATLFLLIAYHPEIILLLLAQQGEEVKQTVMFEITSRVNLAPLALTGIIWWAYWRSFDLGLQGWKSRLVKAALVVGVVSMAVTATLIVSRDIVLMAACGLAIVYLARKSAKKPASLRFVLAAGTTSAICIALLFLGFAFLRGSGSVDDLVHYLLGYTAASYNRLAAVLNGSLRYPFSGRGIYLSSFVAFNHTLNQFVPVGKFMNWPDQLDDWGTQFGAVTRAGLDGNLIWSGAFGYIYSDLGWFSLPFVFGYGMLCGLVWNWIKRGKVLGVVLYPCIGFCVLFWVGSNILLDSPRVLMLAVAIALAGYERVFGRPEGRSVLSARK